MIDHLPLDVQEAWRSGSREQYLTLLDRYGMRFPDDERPPPGWQLDLYHKDEPGTCRVRVFGMDGVGPMGVYLFHSPQIPKLKLEDLAPRMGIDPTQIEDRGSVIWNGDPQLLGLRTQEEATKFLINLPLWAVGQSHAPNRETRSSDLELRLKYLDPDMGIQISPFQEYPTLDIDQGFENLQFNVYTHTYARTVSVSFRTGARPNDWYKRLVRELQRERVVDPSIPLDWIY